MAYTLWSTDPMYTTPFATAGEETTVAPRSNHHLTPMPETFVGSSTFSYGLTPEFVGSKRNLAQSVRTWNRLEAVKPLDCPVARTLWLPGRADLGTVIEVPKDRVSSVVAVPTRRESKVISTCSVGP